jgi:hypothetical protein
MHVTYCMPQDIDEDNILVNCVKGGRPASKGETPGWRSQFPIRHYLNDFEFAAIFNPGSPPSTRVWTITPMVATGHTYGRDLPPEWCIDKPFCPFKVDIWQLGHMFNRYFPVCLFQLSWSIT